MSETTGEIENETRNKVEYETKYVEWRIPNVFALYEDHVYISPFFSTTIDYWEWCFRLVARRDMKDISIDILNYKMRKYSVEYCFGLKNCDGTVEDLVCGTLRGCAIWSFYRDLIEKEELLRRKTELAPSDTLTVTCTLKWKPEVSYSPELNASQKEKSLKLTSLDKLSKNFKDLYSDKESCDVTLKVKDKEYKAHKLVLMTRCSVFAATFKHDTLERQTGIITIPDCEPDSFEEFLKYLYSGELEKLSFQSALNLYYTSDKYNFEELKEFCVEHVKQCLTVETASEIAVFADKYDEMQLFSTVQDFFNKNYITILLTSEWKNLLKNDYHLADKLLTGMASRKI